MNRRLYDLILRHQMYLDGYKNHLVSEWEKALPILVMDLRTEFAMVKYNSLDEMTKKEFKEFKNRVTKIVSYSFGFWQNALMDQLEEFSKVEIKLEKAIIANHIVDPEDMPEKEHTIIVNETQVDDILDNNTITEKDTKHIAWLFLLNQIMAATGMTAKETIANLTFEAVSKISLEINKAFANNLTINELRDIIIGAPSEKFKDGKLETIKKNVGAAIETVIQSFAVTIQTSYTSQFFKKWQWKAILDNRLCEICGFLHNKIFIYGFGPALPAHRKCRCSKVPYTGPMPDEQSASAWKLEQPSSVRTDFEASKNLSLSQFASKLSNILTR